MPFENRSKLEEDAFFVDGIHDDILTQLTRTSALKVISRTSVERFRQPDLTRQQMQSEVATAIAGALQTSLATSERAR